MFKCLFTGIHHLVLDEKNRLIFPAIFRKDNPPEILDGKFIVTPYEFGYLIFRPESVIEEYLSLVQSRLLDQPTKFNQFKRHFYANSTTVQLDKLSRLCLPKWIREKLTFNESSQRDKVILIGAGSFFELWPEELYGIEDQSLNWLSEMSDQLTGKPNRKPY